MSNFPETVIGIAAHRSRLIVLDRAMQLAVVERDAAAFARFLADDYVLVDSKGQLHDKQAVVEEIADPDVQVEVNESSEHQVRVHGDVAVVIAVLQQRGVARGKPYDIPVRYTDTWVRRRGRWVCLSGHASLLTRPG